MTMDTDTLVRIAYAAQAPLSSNRKPIPFDMRPAHHLDELARIAWAVAKFVSAECAKVCGGATPPTTAERFALASHKHTPCRAKRHLRVAFLRPVALR
jgi:hypothetical protein